MCKNKTLFGKTIKWTPELDSENLSMRSPVKMIGPRGGINTLVRSMTTPQICFVLNGKMTPCAIQGYGFFRVDVEAKTVIPINV